MSNELVKVEEKALAAAAPTNEERLAKVAGILTSGDISKMSKVEKDKFVIDIAQAYGLNPWPPPFMIIPTQGGKEILYATKSCADQIRKLHGISLEVTYQGPLKIGETQNPDIYVVQCKATDRDGRTDEEIGAVSIKNLAGETLSNAIMKAITKAKRRVTYAITGLSFLDETEQGDWSGGSSGRAQGQSFASAPSGPRQITPGGTPPMPRGLAPAIKTEVVEAGLPPVEAP